MGFGGGETKPMGFGGGETKPMGFGGGETKPMGFGGGDPGKGFFNTASKPSEPSGSGLTQFGQFGTSSATGFGAPTSQPTGGALFGQPTGTA